MLDKLGKHIVKITLGILVITVFSSGSENSSIDVLFTKKAEAIQTKIAANSLEKLLEPDRELELVAKGFKFAEGAVWHPQGFLLFSDVPANTIYQWQPQQEPKIFRRPSGKANGNILDLQQRLISAEHENRRVSRREKDGTVLTLASHYQEKQLNSPNDLALRSDGSIYFTDPPYGISAEEEELGFYGVYRIAPNGELTLLVDDFIRPNGIVFSPDETRLYVNDSQQGRVRVFQVRADGSLEVGRVFAELAPPDESGAADGMEVDMAGNLYTTAPGGVWIFAPSGELMGKIATPEPATNLAWGDSDRQTLYITTKSGLYRIRLQVAGVRRIN